MDFDGSVKRFIDDRAEAFYRELKPLCGWNARYWEQLALLKLDRFFSSPEDEFLLEESIRRARWRLLQTCIHSPLRRLQKSYSKQWRRGRQP